jgi:CRISPR-associated endoribonuclease Cas6
MRVKIEGEIVEKVNPDKWAYHHGVYSMIMNQLNPQTAQIFHEENKELRLLSFAGVYFTPHFHLEGNVHFYLSGKDSIITEFNVNIDKTRIVRIEDMVIHIKNIILLPSLVEKEAYLFKSNVIANISKARKNVLLEDIPAVEERLRNNAIKKANMLGKEGDISIKLIHPVKNVEQYKNGHIFSWKSLLEVKGDYDVVSTIYEVGCGENTATGHGFLFDAC